MSYITYAAGLLYMSFNSYPSPHVGLVLLYFVTHPWGANEYLMERSTWADAVGEGSQQHCHCSKRSKTFFDIIVFKHSAANLVFSFDKIH